MKYKDILRIMAERGTFTQGDLLTDTQLSAQWVSRFFEHLTKGGWLERVRVGHYWLYSLTARGQKSVAKFKPVDPDERCLMLAYIVEPGIGSFVPPCPNCGVSGEWHSWRGNDGAMGNWECIGCGQINQYVDGYDDIPL